MLNFYKNISTKMIILILIIGDVDIFNVFFFHARYARLAAHSRTIGAVYVRHIPDISGDKINALPHFEPSESINLRPTNDVINVIKEISIKHVADSNIILHAVAICFSKILS
jgi:hypothetical protein